jgi:hypothetical protein
MFLDIIVKFRFYILSDNLKWLQQMTVLMLNHHFPNQKPQDPKKYQLYQVVNQQQHYPHRVQQDKPHQ